MYLKHSIKPRVTEIVLRGLIGPRQEDIIDVLTTHTIQILCIKTQV